MAQLKLFEDIASRTGGDIYIGVVGPVRTGKSTFIRKFMEELVLPSMPKGPERMRIADELPQSGSGRTIMTTQPKFVPGEAVEIFLTDKTKVRVRMVDSVGYLIPGAIGTQENEDARMVRTPWSESNMPFEEAAEFGTRKVMADHATIGLVLTTDGTIADLPRAAYESAEERVVDELKDLGKPFVMVLNSAAPEDPDAKALKARLQKKYNVPVLLLSAENMQMGDIQSVLEQVLFTFPLKEIVITVPGWMNALEESHWLLSDVAETVRAHSRTIHTMQDREQFKSAFAASEYSPGLLVTDTDLGTGTMRCTLPVNDGLFNRVLSEECGTEIHGDAHLLSLMKELVNAKREYDKVAAALTAVKETGYGLVAPDISEMTLSQPSLIRQGSQYGIRFKAHAPSLHLLRVDIETEVAPLVGTEQQSQEMVENLLNEFENDPEKVWNTNFFGKTFSTILQENLSGKLLHMPAETQEKVREALSRMVNEGNGGMICILL